MKVAPSFIWTSVWVLLGLLTVAWCNGEQQLVFGLLLEGSIILKIAENILQGLGQVDVTVAGVQTWLQHGVLGIVRAGHCEVVDKLDAARQLSFSCQQCRG